MKRFDSMVLKFETAIESAKIELEEQGYSEVNAIRRKIFEKGGIKNIRGLSDGYKKNIAVRLNAQSMS